jgi:ATP-binding cassette, subfamily C, bacterial CydC
MGFWLVKLGQGQTKRLMAGATLALVTVMAGVGLLSLSGWFITATALAGVALASGMALVLDIYLPGSGIRFFALSRTLGRYLERCYNHATVLRLLADFRLALFKGLLHLPLAQLRGTTDGEWLSRLTADLDNLDNLLLRLVLPPIVTLLSVVALTLMLSLWWPIFAWLLGLTLFAAVLLLLRFSVNYTSALAEQLASVLNQARSAVIEHLSGSLELRAMQRQGAHQATLVASIQQIAHCQTQLHNRLANLQLATSVLWALLFCVCCGLCLQAVQQGELSEAVAIMLCLALLGLADNILQIPQHQASWGKTRYAANRLYQLLPAEENRATLPSMSAASAFTSLDCCIEGHVQIAKSLTQTIQVRLEYPQHLLIVGRSGSGKSTLANILVGLEPSGSVSTQTLHLASADQLVYLSQQHGILADTLGYNLSVGLPELSENAMWRALALVELSEWAAALPQGLHTWLGATGNQLSGGQARRLALARLLLRDPALVILDEPFNGLDSAMAARIWHNITPWLTKRALILLIHEQPSYWQPQNSAASISLDEVF